MNLSPVISDMQAARWAYAVIEAPACGSSVKALRLKGMQYGIEASLAFMANEPNSTVESYLQFSAEDMQAANDAFDALVEE